VLLEVGVDARALAHGGLDPLDLGDLRADVEVQQGELALEVGGRELAHDREDLVGGEAELGALAARALPAAAAAAVQLGAHADLRDGDPVLLGEDVEVAADLAGALEHDDHVVPELSGVEGHAHELAVLVAVADQQRLLERRLGERQQQLRLAAGLEAVAGALAGA
jgi:hypothetical protein